jgi:hypothetical protein
MNKYDIHLSTGTTLAVEVGPDSYYMLNSRLVHSQSLPLADIDRRHGPTRPFNLNDSLTS